MPTVFQNSEQEIQKIVDFLGLKVSKGLCKAVADKCQFERMKQDKRGLENEQWRTAWRDNNPNYYRKGMIRELTNCYMYASIHL